MNPRQNLWAQFCAAALSGTLASESEEFGHGHRSNVARHAAACADYALAEYDKRADALAAGGLPGVLASRTPDASGKLEPISDED